jgi:cyclopropane-fatty-acyl-phospholipid synthase
MTGLPRTISARRAAGILRKVFERIPTGFAFRLWDGTLVEVGHGAPVCTAVIREPATFIRLIRDPSPLNFAEAYVEGAIDIEGDLFAGMKVADAMEDIRLSTVDRLRLVVSLWRD